MASRSNDDEEMKDIENDNGLYTVMEDIKDRGIQIDDKDTLITITNYESNSSTSAPSAPSTTVLTSTTPTPALLTPTTTTPSLPTTTTLPRESVANENDIPRTRVDSVYGDGSERRSMYPNRRPAQLYSASQPCAYWLSGCCRFGDECHYRHSTPQISGPVYPITIQSQGPSSFSPTVASEPLLVTTPNTYKETNDDQDDDSKVIEMDDKKKRKSGKKNIKNKGKEDEIVSPQSISPLKKGKKKMSKAEINSPSIDSKGSNDSNILDQRLVRELETKVTLCDDDSSSSELMLLDLIQKSPKYFLQLIKINDKSYISEDVADRIIDSRNMAPSSFASLQDIINVFKLPTKKKDFINFNRDVILAYCKQRQDVQVRVIEGNRSELEDQGTHATEREDQGKHAKADHADNDEESQHGRNQQQRKKSERKSVTNSYNQSPSSYEIDQGIQFNQSDYGYDNDESNSNKQQEIGDNSTTSNEVNQETQNQNNQGDPNYYYTYINPANGMQYVYPMSCGVYQNAPPMLCPPADYMNQYPYPYYPPMEYYSPQGGNYNPNVAIPRSTQGQPSPASVPAYPLTHSKSMPTPPSPSSSSPSSSPRHEIPSSSYGYGPQDIYRQCTNSDVAVDNSFDPAYFNPYDYNAQYNTGYYPPGKLFLIITKIKLTNISSTARSF